MNRFRNFGSRTAVAVFHREAPVTETVMKPDANATGMVGGAVQGGGSYAENNAVFVGTPVKALTIAAWHRGLELRMKTMGQLVPQYQRKNKPGDGGNFVENTYGKAGVLNYRLQVRPNPIMTATTFWQQVEFMRIMTGNALVYIERGGDGEPLNFWLCTGGGFYNEITGDYLLNYLSDVGPKQVTVGREDVLHWANTYKWPGSIWGIPTLQFAVQTLSLQATENQQAMENAAKGGRVKLIIGEEKPQSGQGTLAFNMFNKDSADNYAREVSEKIYQQDVVALRGLDKVQQISMSAQEMQLLEQLGFGVAEVGRFLGIPLSLLMDYSNSSYKTPEAATQELMQRTIQPMIGEIEDELNSKLLLPGDWGSRRFHVCELPLLRLDMKSQADIDLKRLQTGWSPNEIRGQYDMPAVDGGDDHYVSTNLAKAGSPKLTGEAMPAVAEPAANAAVTAATNGGEGAEGGDE